MVFSSLTTPAESLRWASGEIEIHRKGKSDPILVISMFYGVILLMYYFDNKKHRHPHIHVQYSDEEAVLSISDGTELEGTLNESNLDRFVQENA